MKAAKIFTNSALVYADTNPPIPNTTQHNVHRVHNILIGSMQWLGSDKHCSSLVNCKYSFKNQIADHFHNNQNSLTVIGK